MKTNAVTPKISNHLLQAGVMQQLAGDASSEARDFRGWLQSEDSAKFGSRELRKQAALIRGLRELAAQAPSGDDDALRQVFASGGNEFAVAGAALPPMFAAALEQAQPILSTFYAARVPQFAPRDLVLSQSYFQAHYERATAFLKAFQQQLKDRGIPVDDAGIRNFKGSAALEVTGETFPLKKGMNGPTCCWGIEEARVADFERAAGLESIFALFASNDLVLSHNYFKAHYERGRAFLKAFQDQLKDRGIPVDEAGIRDFKGSAALEVNGETFTLKKGMNGPTCCWGIAAEDRARFIQAAGLVERSPYALPRVGKNEVPLTPEALAKIFRGTGEDGKELTGEEILERIKAAMHANAPATQRSEAADSPAEAE